MSKPNPTYQLLPYAEFADTHLESPALSIVELWRTSQYSGLGLALTGTQNYEQQLAYFVEQVVPGYEVTVVQSAAGELAGFLAQNGSELEHLYIAPSHFRQGLGSLLLQRAKNRSPTLLELYTFAINQGAQRFYEHHGFTVVGLGQADKANNPWATDPAELADIRYRWQAPG